jgi:hypothetical protein
VPVALALVVVEVGLRRGWLSRVVKPRSPV